MSTSHRRERLPVHGRSPVIPSAIQVCGLVEHAVTLTISDLEQFPHASVVDDFTCLEGWSVSSLGWRGPRLATVVRLTRPRPGASYVTVAAGDFATSLPLADVLDGAGLLALYLDGNPLSVTHGGPCRLVLPGAECFTSIKWVDRVELTDAPVTSSEVIARGRLDAMGEG